MRQKKLPLNVKVKTLIVFLIVFVLSNGISHLQIQHQKDEEQLKASYTAEETIRRIEAQLNKYLSKSDFLKKVIESGHEIDPKEFNQISKLIQDDGKIMEAIELAKGGTVSSIYPLESNKEAMGLDMLTDPYRKASARLAKKSGKYTIAGPFHLVQGGKGTLLFDPIYTKDTNGQKKFWGFSILVINWNHFMEEVQLDQLENTEYDYKIWKKDLTTGKKITLAQCKHSDFQNALHVKCEVPNDTWYFDIEPKDGWFSRKNLIAASVVCFIFAGMVAALCWQFLTRRYKERIYTRKIKKTAEEAKAANSAKTSFLSRMSHDIRTPLNGIIGLLKIDEKHPEDKQLIEDNRKKMSVAADHLLALINDVLQMSKLESGEIILSHEVINLKELSSDILTIMEQRAAECGITLEYDEKSQEAVYPYVYGSPLHLRQIFLNIYGNSIKYNHVGGKVCTYFEYLGTKGDYVTYRCTISDTGIGMSQEFLQHIFEPFAQEHSDARSVYQGTGMGMAIVKSLVDQMGGEIWVESEEGKGTTFKITLSFEIAKKAKQIQKEEKKKQKNVKIRGTHLLLAEDNELNAEIAKLLLEDEGAKVTVVCNGKQAVEEFGNTKPGTYDAILMDVMMPEMDGILATKMIRSMKRQDAAMIPIIAMTANAFDEDARKCLEAGMNAHLSKPLQIEQVLETIHDLCKR